MGRKNNFNQPSNNDQSKANHFSHPHPLNLINTKNQQAQITNLTSCAGCKLKPSGSIYSCATCNFFLHRKCFQMPKMIKHPGHENHVFALLPEPAYASGGFLCDACHGPGNGFSYHCKPCGMDLHILCAVMPQSIAHASHNHELKMGYECTYFTKSFICDICKSPGSNHWLYSCTICGFDAHLKCATGAFPPKNPNNVDNLSAMFSGLGTSSPLTSFGSQFLNPQNNSSLLNNPMMNNNQGFGGTKPDALTSYNQILQQIMDQYKRGAMPQGMTQRSDESTMAYIQQIIDQNKLQGAPGSDVDVQQFMNYLNSLSTNNNGVGGGGNMDFSDALQSLLGDANGIKY